jgi:hypothetical protein
VVAGVVEEAPDFESDAVAPPGEAVFFTLGAPAEVPVDVPSAGFAGVPSAGVPGALFEPDGLLAVGAVEVAASTGLVAGFAMGDLVEPAVEPAVAPAAEFASAGLSGTEGKRCARISEARM